MERAVYNHLLHIKHGSMYVSTNGVHSWPHGVVYPSACQVESHNDDRDETPTLPLNTSTYTSQQLGSEVERQGKANKSTTPRTAQRKEEEELPWVGFEPMTLYSLGERSTS